MGVFGVPDMGPACSDKHVPNYLKMVGSFASIWTAITSVVKYCAFVCKAQLYGFDTSER